MANHGSDTPVIRAPCRTHVAQDTATRHLNKKVNISLRRIGPRLQGRSNDTGPNDSPRVAHGHTVQRSVQKAKLMNRDSHSPFFIVMDLLPERRSEKCQMCD